MVKFVRGRDEHGKTSQKSYDGMGQQEMAAVPSRPRRVVSEFVSMKKSGVVTIAGRVRAGP